RRPSTSPSRSCLLSSFCPAAPPTAIYTLSLHDALPIWACERIAALPDDRRVFCFVNVSALHQPNCHYLPGRERDDVDTQLAALAYVDRQPEPLFTRLRQRAPLLAIVCSDHGTAYGEDGYLGHRLAHPVVWEVPYAELLLDRLPGRPA